MSTKEIPKKVSKNVIDDDKHRGDNEVDESFVNVEADEPGRGGADQSGNDDPSKKSKLVFEEALFQTKYKTEKSNNKQSKRNEVVIVE